jgi:CBS domain-containing protein
VDARKRSHAAFESSCEPGVGQEAARCGVATRPHDEATDLLLTIITTAAVVRDPASREATMTVRAILEIKGRYIHSVEADARLATAVKTLAERRIGAVLVMNGARLEGILSERDIVRVLADRGAAALDDTVGSVMTRNVVICHQDDSVGELMEQMTTGKFRHLPVLEHDRVVGLISIGDIVKSRLSEYEHEQQALHDYIKSA